MPFYRRLTQPSAPPPPPSNKPSLDKFLFLSLLGLLTLWIIYSLGMSVYRIFDSVASPPPGVLVSEDPQVLELPGMASFDVKGYFITPLSSFAMNARVLEVSNYTTSGTADLLSAISPVDFFLGWGKMSDSAVADNLQVKLGQRSFGLPFKGLSLDWGYIRLHTWLGIIVPATPEVASIVMKVRKNNIISMSGYLVNIKTPSNRSVNTSLAHPDDSYGAMAVLWVEKIVINQ